MSTTNTKPTTTKRPANFTKAAWEQDTFRVYTGLIKLVKGEINMTQFTGHPVVKSLFESCGIANTAPDRQKATVNLIISMAKDRTSHGEKERHIAPIYRLRNWFNGEWKVKASLPVTFNAPKDPAKKSSPKGKKTAPKKVKNVSVDQWVKGLTDDQRDELKVAIAMLEMDAA